MGNWKKIEENDSHGIYANAFRSKAAPIQECFDLGIFFGTFESRGLISSKLLQNKSCAYSITVFFSEAQETSLRKKYDSILSRQVKLCSKETVILVKDVSIKNVEENLEKILSFVPSRCWAMGGNWFIDLGGSPIPYFLGLMGYLRGMFPCPKLTIFNPTGDYGEKEQSYTFTSGFDKNIWVPQLWGRPDPSLPWTYVFLLGFDGERSYEIFYRCEPDKVRALVGDPGYKQGYESESIQANEKFLKESGLLGDNAKNKLIKANAANPIETWEKLEKICADEYGKSNVCFVPLGPKAHALGSGLCALTDGAPAILYHMPRTYSVRDVKRGEYLWKYEIVF